MRAVKALFAGRSKWLRLLLAAPAIAAPLGLTVACQQPECRTYTYNTNVLTKPFNVGVLHVSATLYACWDGNGNVTTFEPRGLYISKYGALSWAYDYSFAGPYRTAPNAVLWTLHTRQCYGVPHTPGVACAYGTDFWIGGHFDPPWKVGFHSLGGTRVRGTEEALSN